MSAKKSYAETLQNLEKISDDIHLQRQQERRREKKARKLATAAAATNATIVYHPLMEAGSSSDDDSGNETSGDMDCSEFVVPPLSGVVDIKSITVRQIDCMPVASVADSSTAGHSMLSDTVKPQTVDGAAWLSSQQSEASRTPSDVETADLPSSVHCTSSLAESTSSPVSPESDVEQANAAVMAAISRSKLQRVASPFLRPDACREDYSANGGSETESISGSFVSGGGLCALDDEQIESLMVDVTEYERIVADADLDHCHQMELPARLRHLQEFVKFEPIWILDGGDVNDAVVGTTSNSEAVCHGSVTKDIDNHTLVDNESTKFDVNSGSGGPHSCIGALDKKKECQTGDKWHPLMYSAGGTGVSGSATGYAVQFSSHENQM